MRGKMIWFNEEKNHGFISTDEGERLYVHGSGFTDAPPVGPCNGLNVEFHIAGDEEAGRRAEGARIIADPVPRRARRRGSR
jgi:cold shock CspA family protein